VTDVWKLADFKVSFFWMCRWTWRIYISWISVQFWLKMLMSQPIGLPVYVCFNWLLGHWVINAQWTVTDVLLSQLIVMWQLVFDSCLLRQSISLHKNLLLYYSWVLCVSKSWIYIAHKVPATANAQRPYELRLCQATTR